MAHSEHPPLGEMRRIPGGNVTTPLGFSAAGVTCGIKKSGKPDLAIIHTDIPAACGGVFTTNKVRAACVDINRERVAKGTAQTIVVNSGNANAFTGKQGYADALAMCESAALALHIDTESVLGCSTGVIGEPMPMECVCAGIAEAVAGLSNTGGNAAAEAILTTDLVAKTIACEVTLSGGSVNIGAIAKGSGMIEPNMATMFCFLTTDACIAAPALQIVLKDAADQSFNCLTVDGDTSTNDMTLILANGASGVAVESGDAQAFQHALTWVCQEMAKAIASDGEGATKLVEIRVKGAASDDDARRAAKTIANSPLVKTALYGQDPNWGRILAAAGRSGAEVDQSKIDLSLQDEALVRNGEPLELSDTIQKGLLSTDYVTIDLDLHIGEGSAVVWTCDLSYDYVKINADYHT
jgi:glutamate N-acetyltransferase/amino-acid N-acetyltransferase